MSVVAWPSVALGEVVNHRKEFIVINDLETYRRPRVQLHAQGIVLRDAVPGALIKTKKQQVARAGEFLVAEIDAKVGGFGIVPADLDGSIVSSHYFLFGHNPDRINNRFLGWFIKTPTFRKQVEAQGSTNYAAIRPADVLGYKIPLPPLDEQRRVVARIQELAAKVEEALSLRAVSQDELSALQLSRSRAVFAPFASLAVPLEEVCVAVIDTLHSNPVYAEDGTVPCIRSPDFGYGTLDLTNARRTQESEYQRRTIRGEPQADDIVLVREGGGTGKCALVERGQRFSLGQRVMMIRPNTAKVRPKFFLYQLLSPTIQEDHIRPLSKGSASPHLNIGALRHFPFALPTLEVQDRVIAGLNNLQTQLNAATVLQQQTAAELTAMLPAILDKAFKGDL
jgi:type I restriction enzyme S subunit